VKSITVRVDEDLYRRARMRAADHGTSVAAVARGALREYASDVFLAERRAQALRSLFERVDARLRDEKAGGAAKCRRRDQMHDERFAETALGRSLAARRQ
jgi:plasmid stability protein